MRRRAIKACAVGALSIALALVSLSAGRAQTPSPEAPEGTPVPSEPIPSPDPVTSAPTTTPGTPPPTPSPVPTPTASPVLRVPVLERTPPRNTAVLVETLLAMTEWGLSLEQVLIEGMGRFPVAGYAHYSDDWLAARYKPTPHLHRGLDIFAALGTPIRAPDAGVVTSVSDSYPGGKSVTMRTHDGTEYYFAHLSSRAWGLLVGQSVEVGTVLGYVGDTGNAQGGSPHLHLEVTKDGSTVPPKPMVDGWLEEAGSAAGDWMERKRLEIEVGRRLELCPSETSTTQSVTLFQILDDPIELDLGAASCSSELIAEPDRSLVELLVEPSA